MSKRTINEAIVEVLKKESKGLTSKEIYEKIVKLNLYQFKSTGAMGIIRNQLRRHCENVYLGASSKIKIYLVTDDQKFRLK